MTETHAHTHPHTPRSGHTAAEGDTDATYWDARYGEAEKVWSGQPNALLVRAVGDLTPGTALELGCGEGADSIWLAQNGWTATGVDIAANALSRAARHAAEAGVTDRIAWHRADLVADPLPAGPYDLVCAQYYHSPAARAEDREDVLLRAAHQVAPGGHLLVVGHAAFPSWVAEEDRPDVHFPTTTEVLTTLALDPSWSVVLEELVPHDAPSPEGVPGTRADNVLLVHRGR